MSVISDVQIGSVITFRSKAVNDNNFYYGKVTAICTSEVAEGLTVDIFTYNSNVQSADFAVPAVDLQLFFIIKLLEPIDDTTKYVIPFSADWINLPTLNIISTNKVAHFKVFDVDEANAQNVIDLLLTAGFKSKLESLS